MVQLHLKRETTSLFLYEASTATSIEEILKDLVEIFNLRLKIKRILMEVECLADHGIFKPPEMLGIRVTIDLGILFFTKSTRSGHSRWLGLLEEQIKELKLVDEESEKRIPEVV